MALFDLAGADAAPTSLPNGTFYAQQRRQSVHPTEVRIGTEVLRITRANQIPVVAANWLLAQGKSLPLIPNFVHEHDIGFALSAQTKQLDNRWHIEVGESFDTLVQKAKRLLDACGLRSWPYKSSWKTEALKRRNHLNREGGSQSGCRLVLRSAAARGRRG